MTLSVYQINRPTREYLDHPSSAASGCSISPQSHDHEQTQSLRGRNEEVTFALSKFGMLDAKPLACLACNFGC